MRASDATPLGCSLLLPVDTIIPSKYERCEDGMEVMATESTLQVEANGVAPYPGGCMLARCSALAMDSVVLGLASPLMVDQSCTVLGLNRMFALEERRCCWGCTREKEVLLGVALEERRCCWGVALEERRCCWGLHSRERRCCWGCTRGGPIGVCGGAGVEARP